MALSPDRCECWRAWSYVHKFFTKRKVEKKCFQTICSCLCQPLHNLLNNNMNIIYAPKQNGIFHYFLLSSCFLTCLSSLINQRIPLWAVCSTHWVETQWEEHWARAAWPPAYRRAPTRTTSRESLTQRWPSIRHPLAQYWSRTTCISLASIQLSPRSFPIRG